MALEPWVPREDGFCVAQICLNGHVVTTRAEVVPYKLLRPFCSKCGKETFVKCPHCQKTIRGAWPPDEIDFAQGPVFEFPHFCPECGAPYPWTAGRIQAAKELAAELDGLSDEEREQLVGSLEDLIGDGPRTSLAATRFTRLMSKANGTGVPVFEEMVAELASSAAKRALGIGT
jgi:hypothetical protein